jgi:uncharacterized cupredoxin-like copper-binding protein
MKIVSHVIAGLMALSLSAFGAEDTLKEKSKDAWQATKDTTKSAGQAVKRGAEKTVEAVKDAVDPTPEKQVQVRLEENSISMPGRLKAGEVEFVVTNTGKGEHNFEIEGAGLDKKFFLNLRPGETKKMDIRLKPGEYKVDCPVKDHSHKGMAKTLIVE